MINKHIRDSDARLDSTLRYFDSIPSSLCVFSPNQTLGTAFSVSFRTIFETTNTRKYFCDSSGPIIYNSLQKDFYFFQKALGEETFDPYCEFPEIILQLRNSLQGLVSIDPSPSLVYSSTVVSEQSLIFSKTLLSDENFKEYCLKSLKSLGD